MLKEGKIKVSELSNHPQNDYYFDDIKGDGWDDLLQSIRTSGVTNAVTITQNKTIISGHQRVRACKVLGIEEVSYKMIEYDDGKKQIKDLIESNLKQRVVGNPNPIKLGRCFDFLRDYYEIQHGGDRKSELLKSKPNNSDLISNSDLASTYNVSVDTMENYIKLSKAIPEVATLVETGTITKTTALAMMKNLSEKEQEELIDNLDVTKKYTQKQIQEYVDKLKEKDDENNILKIKIDSLSQLEDTIKKNQEEQTNLKKRISELVQQGTKTEIVTQEVDKPETLEQIKILQKQLEEKTSAYTKLYDKYLEENKLVSIAMGTSTNYQLISRCSEITLKMTGFIEEMSKYDYMAETFNEIPDATRIEYVRCINSVKKWADRILDTIQKEENIING